MEPSQLIVEFGKELFALTSAIVIPVAGLLIAGRVVRNRRNPDRTSRARPSDRR